MALAAVGTAVLLAGLGPAPVVRAATAKTGPTRKAVACLPGGAQARTTRADDQPDYTPRQLRRIDRQLALRLAARSVTSGTARFGLVMRIPVHVHVIDGTREWGPSRQRVLRQLQVLNDAYAGGQSAANTSTPFAFYLESFQRVRNQRWRTATMFDQTDQEMRRALHVGGRRDLNLYFSAPVSSEANGVILGWSSVPWRVDRAPRLDGVTIHHYNLGDTTVHEVGHWLGLFHTFEGGCSPRNDGVEDTPAEATPSDGCPVGRDTCEAPGLDPIHNFMDYSFDTCMDRFTPGQVSRMTDNWLAYRTP